MALSEAEGHLVWAHRSLDSLRKWPAVQLKGCLAGLPNPAAGHSWVFWCEDGEASQVPDSDIEDFRESFTSCFSFEEAPGKFIAVVTSVVREIANRFHDTTSWSDEDLVSWVVEANLQGADTHFAICIENDAESSVCEREKSEENQEEEEATCKKFKLGDLVWARVKSHSRSWPAMVINGEDCGLASTNSDHSWLYWLGDGRISSVPDKFIEEFEANVQKYFCTKGAPKKVLAGLAQASKICANRRGIISQDWDSEFSLQWAKLNLLSGKKQGSLLKNGKTQNITKAKTDTTANINDVSQYTSRLVKKGRKRVSVDSLSSFVPNHIVKRLKELSSLNEKTAKKRDVEKVVKDKEDEEKRSEELYQKRVEECSFIVDEGEENLCVSCGIKRDEPFDKKHPWLKGFACERCQDPIMNIIQTWAKTGFKFACEECGSKRAVFVCPVPACARLFCRSCSPNFSSFMCNECDVLEDAPACYSSIRPNWKCKIWDVFYSLGYELPVKPALRVLSLFDGIGTGLLVLDQLGLHVDKYYASEVNPAAIAIVNAHFPGRVTHLGDIAQLTRSVLTSMGPIHLLIGGSPCNQLSRVNATAKGLLNVEGSGVLFFDFVRILRDLRDIAEDTTVFWMFENVSSMRKDFRAIMSRSLECEPSVWNAADFSPQRRPRLFWGNIPGLHSVLRDASPQNLSDVLTRGCYREAAFDIVNTITTNRNSQLHGRNAELPIVMDGRGDRLWITEVERVFGFPTHYTDVGNFSMTCRNELLGRAWSVPVLKKILQPLTHFYATRKD